MERALHPWPEQLAQEYEHKGYWQPLALGEQFRCWASRYAARTALIDGTTRLSYADLDARIDRLAAGFHALGLVAGDRVLVQLPNSAGFVAACFALFRLGVVPVLAMPAQRSAEIDGLCQLAEPTAYLLPARFLGFDYRPMAKEIAARPPSRRFLIVDDASGPDLTLTGIERPRRESPPRGHRDVALLLLSGGTTGTPKLIPRTHADYAYAARASAELCGLGPDSITLAALPLAHNFPLCCPGLIGTFSVGGTVVLARTPGFDEAFPLITRERVTLTALVPALARLWAAARAWNRDDLSSLALLQVGGAQPRPASRIEVPQVETAEAEPYRHLVAAAVAEIRQGLYQKVILSRRVTLTAMPDLIASYLTGRRANTPARSFLLRRDGFQAAGSSPETVVEVAADGAVSTQPLAGTRALGPDPAEEERLRAELLSDAKEVAEHAVSVKLAHEELEEVCALDAALVLRTVYRQGDEAWLQAGAGLVALSTPEREFRATCEKLGSVSPHLVAATAEGGQERIGRALEGACA